MNRFILFTILAICIYGGYSHFQEKKQITNQETINSSRKNINPVVNQEVSTSDQSLVNNKNSKISNDSLQPSSDQSLPTSNDFVENPSSESEPQDLQTNSGHPAGSSTPDGNGIVPEENPSSGENSVKDATPNSLVSCQTQIKNCEPKESQQFDDPNVNTFCITYAYNCISPDSIQRVWKEEEVFRPQVEPSSDTITPVDNQGYNFENPPEVQEPAEPVYDEAPQYQEPSDDMNY